jgi:uncharacterized protein YyaL (SSP411 family)
MRRREMSPSLTHLRRLTDGCGLIQHANHAVPDYRSGYTVDDNARALVACARHFSLFGDEVARELTGRYLAFLMYAQTEDGRFHNFVGYDRTFLDKVGTEDAFARALWGLTYLLYAPPQPGFVGPAERMLHQALPWVARMEHPRARAMCATALYWWAKSERGDPVRAAELARPLAQYLVDRYREHCGRDWHWILPELTYSNAKLPEALFRAYEMTGEESFLEVGTRSLCFLYGKTFAGDMLSVVGNRGWYESGGSLPALYDQQPVDAAAMVETSLAAFHATGEDEHLRRATLALEWFFGRNVRSLPLYDEETGGCFDGLTEAGVNLNRGAESTVSLLLAHLAMLEIQQTMPEAWASSQSLDADTDTPDSA